MTTSVTLHEGDNRDHLRRLIDQGVRVHSVVTDPPYGLVSVTKRFGGEAAAPAKFGSDGAFKRASAGFMGSKWDGTGIERDPEFWRLIHDILLPGGYVVAFASSRTFARMAVAIEDAGFITHPMLGWLFGSGFPKAHNTAMAIDKALGIKGTRDGVKPGHEGFEGRDTIASLRAGGAHAGEGGFSRPWMEDAEKVADYHKKYVPGSLEAAQWEGWAYGAQALKPALEPIYVGQKPFDGKTGAPSILKHGVGAINIDGCRVPVNDTAYARNCSGDRGHAGTRDADQIGVTNMRPGGGSAADGRHPANLLHDGSDEVVALFPESKGQQAKSSDATRSQVHTFGAVSDNGKTYEPRNDTGSAARFFNAFPPEEPYPTFYAPKAGKADRAGSKHPTVKPVALMRWLCRLITPPGGTVLDPFGGSGTTGEAARLEGFASILMEAEPQFAADIRRRFDLACPDVHYNSEFDDLLGGDSADELEDILG